MARIVLSAKLMFPDFWIARKIWVLIRSWIVGRRRSSSRSALTSDVSAFAKVDAGSEGSRSCVASDDVAINHKQSHTQLRRHSETSVLHA